MIYHPEKQNFAVRPDDKRLRPRVRHPAHVLRLMNLLDLSVDEGAGPEFVEGITRSDLSRVIDDSTIGRKSRAKVRELKAAVRLLIGNKWTAYQWKGELHEEGCPGVRLAPSERYEGDECKCDGDEIARIVVRALR